MRYRDLEFTHPFAPRMMRLVGVALAALPTAWHLAPAANEGGDLPTIFIAGDSTAANGNSITVGWGKHLGDFFDPAKVNVVNRARGGRSSRTFITEGLWDQLIADVKAGDVVLIQFGHNDVGAINDDRRARGSIPGLGDETEEIDNQITKQHEVVHTFGWYLRKMVNDVQARNARPIVMSLTVRNIWEDGHVERGLSHYGEWSREVAEAEHVPFIDLTTIVADRYEAMGQESAAALFPRDHTHTSNEGAVLNAKLIVAGLKGLGDASINRLLSAEGRSVSAIELVHQP